MSAIVNDDHATASERTRLLMMLGGAALAGAAGAAIVVISTGHWSAASLIGSAPSESRSDDYALELPDLRARIESLHLRVRDLETSAAREPQRVVDARGIDGAIERILRAKGVALDDRSTRADTRPAADETMRVQDALQQLLALGPNGDRGELWTRIRNAGKLDAVIAALAERATANPGSADVRVELGLAYVQKLLDAPEGAERTRIGALADEAFTKALELDPTHWDARFRKAEGLSYWPVLSGKQGEAIGHFEALVAQQAAMSPKPEHASVYLYLGNLYERQGKTKEALAIWSTGLQRHPDVQALRDKLKIGR